MRCLEKDRHRRYATANELALDVQRHLADEPVDARPPTAGYRLWKLARRHRIAFGATAAVALSLIAGVTLSTLMLLREKAARERAVAAEAAQARLRLQ